MRRLLSMTQDSLHVEPFSEIISRDGGQCKSTCSPSDQGHCTAILQPWDGVPVQRLAGVGVPDSHVFITKLAQLVTSCLGGPS